ncbi:hypothetical protein V6N13_125682 [Hibiscus sabdariffa]
MISFLLPDKRLEAEQKLGKRGRGRPKKKSLLDSDFLSRKRALLKEARETLEFRKYIGAKVVENEEEIVKDIARILEARVKRWGCDVIMYIVGDFNMVLQIFECQRVFITTGGELVTMNALLVVPVV